MTGVFNVVTTLSEKLIIITPHCSYFMFNCKIAVLVLHRFSVSQSLWLPCTGHGNPQPIIHWVLYDGAVIRSNRPTRDARISMYQNGTLLIRDVTPSDSGKYECIVGKDEMHVHITVVTAAPRIRPPMQTYAKVKPGGNIRFDCEAAGEPKPKILWMLPTNDVIAASNERYLMHVNGSLDIRDVKLIDAGQYVCMARNPAGENRKVYQVDIDGNPPVINGYHQNRTVIRDVASKYSRKFIDCKAEVDAVFTLCSVLHQYIKCLQRERKISLFKHGKINVHWIHICIDDAFIKQ
uniref:Ig-like domain-containing protein n=1 Tax=Sphaeramia orbicularis TaxID=375764 RepID=A0A673BKX1_9TELE